MMDARTVNAFDGKYAVPALLALAGLATRAAFADTDLFNMDTGNFALAVLNGFDMTLHHPHPPGYFLYVMLGRLVASAGLAPTAALCAISIAATTLYIPLIYLVARRLYGAESALAAGVFALFSPLLFMHGIVGLSYIVEALMAAAIAWLSLKAKDGSVRALWLSAAVLGVSGGFRQTTIIFMYPLWLYCISGHGAKKAALSHAVTAVAALTWFLPMVLMSGGLPGYLEALDSQATMAVWNGISILQSFEFASIQAYVITWALAAALPPLLAVSLKGITRGGDRLRPGFESVFLLSWAFPALMFYVLIISKPFAPGYGLVYMGALYIAAGHATASEARRLSKSLGGRRAIFACGLVLISAVNTALLFTLDFNFSYRGMEENKRTYMDYARTVREDFSPEDTVLLGGNNFLVSFRHAEWYLPEYRTYCTSSIFSPDGGYYFLCTGRETRKLADFELPEGVRYGIYFCTPPDTIPAGIGGRVVHTRVGRPMVVFDIGNKDDFRSLPRKVHALERASMGLPYR